MSRKAFTLLEAVIVLAIMMMFFAISIPLFSRFTESTKLQGSARSVASVLRTARSYAISNTADYYAAFDTVADPDEYYIYDGTDVVDKKYKLPIGIWFCRGQGTAADPIDEAIEFTNIEIIDGDNYKVALFRSTGALAEGAANIFVYISDGDTAAAVNTIPISVERTTGRVRIE
jgi:type II secretory pathway pseudopilin PulG